jgi:acetylornithine deacetylase
MNEALFRPEDERLLLHLVEVPTVSPMETGAPSDVRRAQADFAEHAARVGFEVVLHEPAPAAILDDPCVPLSVREMAARMGPEFLQSQPNLVLRLGPARPAERTVMFNFHMDTVDGTVPVGRAGGRFHGRGAVDMKGPGVALLAGARAALARWPGLTDDVTVLLQCVSGEEGGAMGTYGTRALVAQGHVGRLNVFAEPSDGYYFDHATTTMTARIEVDGEGATDDEPAAGHNATLLLGYLAQHLGKHLAGPIHARGGKVCIAGLHTGLLHNRVYPAGRLLVNCAYDSPELAEFTREAMERHFAGGRRQFQEELGEVAVARRTADDVAAICRLTWLKRGLPVLANRDPALEPVLARAGWWRNPEERRGKAFTCDAMWAQGEGLYTVVFGPGDLGRNGAHTDREFIDRDDLERYAGQVCALLGAFADHLRRENGGTP